MSMRMNVVTGATGLLGSHIVERLAERGERVRALVRATSETGLLKELGVEIVVGDLHDAESLRRAVSGADVVFHCAAKVGDWGRWSEFQSSVIDATTHLLAACEKEQVGRFVYVSSVQVYGRPGAKQITEDEPLGQNLRHWEKYARSKIEAEKLCRQYPGAVTILRPSWIYGPRDRHTLPRIINGLRAGRMGLIGAGSHKLNLVYAGDVAEAAIAAAYSPDAAGQAYNLTSPGEVTQREWFDIITETLGMPRVQRSLSPRMAYAAGWFSELVGRAIFLQRSPYVTRYGVGLMLRPTNYSNEKAKRELDWSPQTPVREGMRRTLEWYHVHA